MAPQPQKSRPDHPFGRSHCSGEVFSNCAVNGKIGTSLSNLVTLTAENYFQYVGQKESNTNINTDNIKFAE